MEVVKNFENKLLNRKEVVGKIASDGATPSRGDVKSQLAKQLKVKEELIVVNKIESNYGASDFVIDANVYNDEATLKKLTIQHIQKRNEAKVVEEEVTEEAAPVTEAPAAEAAPAEEAKEEAASEEVKEEAPAQEETKEE